MGTNGTCGETGANLQFPFNSLRRKSIESSCGRPSAYHSAEQIGSTLRGRYGEGINFTENIGKLLLYLFTFMRISRDISSSEDKMCIDGWNEWTISRNAWVLSSELIYFFTYKSRKPPNLGREPNRHCDSMLAHMCLFFWGPWTRDPIKRKRCKQNSFLAILIWTFMPHNRRGFTINNLEVECKRPTQT